MVRSWALVACLVALPAAAAIAEPAGLAPALRAPPGEAPAFALSASGAQLYRCSALTDAANAYAWVPTAPDVTLFEGAHGVARLAAQNQWESLDDRSSVSGVPRRIQSGGPGNLPWETLAAVPTGDSGIFANVTAIQRVNTRGGAAPQAPCNDANLGEEARVDFTADYYFYKPAGAG